jgi:N-acyl-phosphatidylethanolamine-hydrolysing phospholipase D
VLAPVHRYYFAGDTGFCEQEFTKLGRLYGPFDLAALPIGCFTPRFEQTFLSNVSKNAKNSEFMRPIHIGPEEAVRIHQMIRAKKSIGIHWGTFARSKGSQEVCRKSS